VLLLSLHLCRKRVSESQSANLGWENQSAVPGRDLLGMPWQQIFSLGFIFRFPFIAPVMGLKFDSNLDRTLIFGETTTPKTAGTPEANAPVALLWVRGTTHEA